MNFLLAVENRLATIAMNGRRTKCACGYYEYALDVGPLAILFNTNGETDSAVEVQLFGRPIYHGWSDVDGAFGFSILGLRYEFVPDCAWYERAWDYGYDSAGDGRIVGGHCPF